MRLLGKRIRFSFYDEDATATVEYALLLALVVIGCISAWLALGAQLKSVITRASNTISQPVG